MWSAVCLLIVLAIGYRQTATLPKCMVPCSRRDPNLNECARKHGQEAIPFVLKGNPGLTPLHLQEIKYSDDTLFIQLRNIVAFGLENVQIKEMNLNLTKQHILIALFIMKVTLIADYSLLGHLEMVPVRGSGGTNITFVGGEYTLEFDYKLTNRAGENYMEIINDRYNFKTKKAFFRFDKRSIQKGKSDFE
ncbi:protein takeout-like isoform X2 [Photinus pyralis]|uniref:protein takeout-like isoform X2 n=1 Tax=Photinus pyralis TaxID=7054 RepID=UPI0012672402|nr:protein takeout-like isoform X2 [Photinus pyralis]